MKSDNYQMKRKIMNIKISIHFQSLKRIKFQSFVTKKRARM